MRDAFIDSLSRLAEQDDRILLITGDLGFGVLNDFAARFPKQFLNAGVAEQNMTLMASGMGMDGRTVFTYSIGNFPTLRALEMIRNDACYHNANVKVVCIGGGFSYGQLGISHHATEDLAILRALPNITVVAPGDDYETVEATKAITALPGTCYLRLDRASMTVESTTGEPFVLGRARTVRRGDDVTLMSTGGMLGEAMKAAELLAKQGIECSVVSMHTLKPLDTDAIRDAVENTPLLVTLEEHVVEGGLAGAVSETCLENGWIPRGFVRIGLQSKFSSIVGDQDYLRAQYGLDALAVSKRVLEKMESMVTASR
ncbi:MAG: transketolase [Chthonomonas sp.]|nr:transketolase [Chthonomonas sp.]